MSLSHRSSRVDTEGVSYVGYPTPRGPGDLCQRMRSPCRQWQSVGDFSEAGTLAGLPLGGVTADDVRSGVLRVGCSM